MKNDRRTFLKIAGLSALTVGLCPLEELWAAKGTTILPNPRELKGGRWAMVVIAGRCQKGCTDCVDACHKVHNIPDFGNSKDEIKWISREPFARAFPGDGHEHMEKVAALELPVLCNHCDNPPCVRVCPTQATFKRKDGIVAMDYHRCIGCRFCMAACPYGSRSMNFRDPRTAIKDINPDFPTRTKGVVEKCNFCAERLEAGLSPACVTACTNKALIFGDLHDPKSEVRKMLAESFTIRRRAELGTEPRIYYVI